MKRLRILTVIALALACGIHFYKQFYGEKVTMAYYEEIPDEWFANEGEILTPRKDRRKADQTFLTYPEWFLVFSPEEQAEFFKTKTSSEFKYVDHLDQFWDSYELIKKPIAGRYKYNDEYHLMIKIIGHSTDLEYGAKSWYETVIGRLSQTSEMTAEDRFDAKFTDDYARSLHEVFWYDFDFKSRLKSLWTETDFWGANMHRKLERRYFLTSELIFKMLYAEVIKFGAHTMYGQAPSTTGVVVDRVSPNMKADSTIEVVEIRQDGTGILRIPRYTAFKETAGRMAAEGVNFSEVAGNKSLIMLTLLVPKNKRISHDDVRLLFSQKISTDESLKRIALVTPVGKLAEMLRYFRQKGIRVEHVYDY